MKKISIIILLLVLSIHTYAYRILERNATGGGFWGYKTVTTTLNTYTYVVNGVVQTITGLSTVCSGSAYASCPKLGAQYNTAIGSGGPHWDSDQVTTVDSITAHIENQVTLNHLIGTYQLTVQVAGETWTRVYYATWNYPSSGDLLTGTITIDRTDVPN